MEAVPWSFCRNLVLCVPQSNVDDLEDASNELMLVDDEEVCIAAAKGGL